MAGLRRPDRLAVEWWLVLLAAALLVGASVASHITERFDLLLYDFAQRQWPHAPRQDILLVAVDDRSLAEIGPWPWPRATQAQVLTALAKARPRAVGLDVLLLEQGDKEGDEALAAAIRAGPPTFLPVQFSVPGRDGAAFDLLEPLPPFRAAATALGHVNLAPDADGVMRRVYLNYGAGPKSWAHLASLMAEKAGKAQAPPPPPSGSLTLEGQRPALIAYTGPQGSFPAISAASVLRGEVPPALLAGRLVLVGVTATGIGDIYATPVGTDHSLMPGLEIQANLLSGLLLDRLILPVEGAFRYVFALVPILAMMLGLRRLRPRWTLWLLAGLLGGVLGGALLLLGLRHVWLAPGSALLGLIAIYPLWSWRRLATLSAHIATELEKLEAEHDPLERPRPALAQADFVERQIGLLRSAIDRERDLRRFLVDRIAQMPDAVVITDPAGRVVIANDGALDLWASLGGDGLPATVDALLARLKTTDEGAPRDLATGWQIDAATADGRSFALRCEPQRAADEAVIGAVIRLAETTQAVLAQRQREEVLELLSHDMRAPQVSILTLLDQGDALAPAISRRIRDYAERTLGLADGFVQLARAQSLRYEPQPIDLGDVLQEAAGALWPQAHSRGITVLCDAPETEVLVAGDRSLLARMFVNLIENAVRFSAEGQVVSVRLQISPDDPLSCEAQVEDHGAGMAPEQLERIFERFESGTQTSGKGSGGLGLGLAFVHTTAQRHGARIACESQLGKGTLFRLRFPLCREDF